MEESFETYIRETHLKEAKKRLELILSVNPSAELEPHDHQLTKTIIERTQVYKMALESAGLSDNKDQSASFRKDLELYVSDFKNGKNL